MQQAQVWSPGWEEPLEKGVAPISVFLPGEFHGQRSLTGYGPWGHKELDTTEATQQAGMCVYHNIYNGIMLSRSIFLTQGSNLRLLCLLHWLVDSLHQRRLGSPRISTSISFVSFCLMYFEALLLSAYKFRINISWKLIPLSLCSVPFCLWKYSLLCTHLGLKLIQLVQLSFDHICMAYLSPIFAYNLFLHI